MPLPKLLDFDTFSKVKKKGCSGVLCVKEKPFRMLLGFQPHSVPIMYDDMSEPKEP